MLTLLDTVNQGQARVSEGQHCSVRVRHRGGGKYTAEQVVYCEKRVKLFYNFELYENRC